MARQQARPGRTLAVFFLTLAILFGLVALTGTWKPALGLDLRGGTRIQMKAEGNPSEASLREAAAIIDQRVNGSGVSEAEVTTDSNGYITVEIPGQNRADLVATVERQAQLRFRLVAKSGAGSATASGSPSSSPGSGVLLPTPSATKSPTADAPTSPSTQASPSGKGRAPYTADNSKSPGASAGAGASDSASAPASDGAGPSDAGSSAPADGATTPSAQRIQDELTWTANPDADSVKAYDDYACPAPGEPVKNVTDDPDKPLVTCDDAGTKYLLSKALIEGTQLKTAAANPPDQAHSGWYVTLSFDGDATKDFGTITTALYNNGNNFAVVLDGQVIEAAGVNEPITGGSAEITGGFTEASAKSLATSLKYGALPISFGEPLTETVGPSLAGNQLSGGIVAGLLGLILVMIYSLLYYRGLGLVIMASLVIAAAWTYALVLLLAKTAGFTLTLPGIAGLIVAVGITADSFIVYFERIRDEMRDGKSMRVAVEAGWKRAWRTCLAADTVSLLAAVVLYIFAAGVVKGFAFALGLSTLIDLLVFVWFTHPMVSFLARYPFFNKGHKLSGLDAENLGLDVLPAGGRA